MGVLKVVVTTGLAFAALTLPSMAQEKAIFDPMDRIHPVWAEHGMVAAQERLAAEIGRDILAKGGNAVDAGVAVAFALAVTLPQAGNIGGGGFMIVHDGPTGKTVAIDYREKAPAGASRDMFLDAQGNADSGKSLYSGAASGVPGTVAGMKAALDAFGSMDWAEVIAPAIRLAEGGIVVTPKLADSLKDARKQLEAFPSSARIFLKEGGADYRPGDRLVQADLAATLKTIAAEGPDGFYKGAVAEKISAAVQAAGGLITPQDMADYTVVMREPVRGGYRGYEIVSMPPPSSGGVHLVQILNALEGYPIGALGQNTGQTLHLMAETMKLAYADRAHYLGDPDFTAVPVAALTSKDYAAAMRETISADFARPSATIGPGDLTPYESDQTTHFSIIDKNGSAVANTYTLNLSYGSGLVAEGTGVLMNNEMDDFSAKPGVPNAFGLVGGDANAVQAGKRPLSSMTPTIVLKDGKVWLVTGSPGGARIITTVLQVIMNMIDHKMNVAEASTAPRAHHQWLPDELRIEEGISLDTIRILQAKGHTIALKPAMGSTQSIMRDGASGAVYGASDPRDPDAATVGY
ncbi:gamma-glutamyltransferase [Rhodospirillum rubrum]|uniref:Glutathione hydrolase proenzyme n=1 Tax=Rhodospirillum rubrum (strain ATCC 11170 / ATH 1.1.1 / DSM 467 / LMG 4362 / NCIMB 8255 / S1) TaxID=269796 RepID=Q2RXF5_RHORT|nr:gamma-glutamyltransferase [Rhodospirillum rubrum]ABC21190.1 gamma-glutamyltransferase 1. Threonine peptidase. MEROPS family T03 [Rhodospirillum rubrum ATCC 11170]AEO46864.1 gamma-glutamyltransferase 1 [Rhodospirillum rubrum F11]MBK5952738.1 gamma-glutamyltransferase [Rhodospirillum rubrum]QXG80881.1 gamma-glutamyltransferase [Rhodospirillum rubrum]